MRFFIAISMILFISCATIRPVAAQGCKDDDACQQSSTCPVPPRPPTLINHQLSNKNMKVLEGISKVALVKSEEDWVELCEQYPFLLMNPAIAKHKNWILNRRQKYQDIQEEFWTEEVDAIKFDSDAKYRDSVKERVSPTAYRHYMGLYNRQKSAMIHQAEHIINSLELSEDDLQILMARMDVAARQRRDVRHYINRMMNAWSCAVETAGFALDYSKDSLSIALSKPFSTMGKLARGGLKVAGLTVLMYLGYLVTCVGVFLAGATVWDLGLLAWLASHLLFIQKLVIIFPAFGTFLTQLGIAGFTTGLALGAANPLNPDRGQSGKFLQLAQQQLNYGSNAVYRGFRGELQFADTVPAFW